MSKFKIKNRKKRRYIRRQPFTYKTKTTQHISSVSTPRISVGGFMPIVAALFGGTALAGILSTQSFSFSLPAMSFQLPTVSFPSISLPTLPTINNPFTAIQLPQITAPEIALPQISLLPLQRLLMTLLQNMAFFFTAFFQGIVAIILFLNPFPAMGAFAKQMIIMENALLQMTMMNVVWTFVAIYKLQLMIFTFGYTASLQALTNILTFINLCIQAAIATGIFLQIVFIKILNTTSNFGTATGETISIPFKKLGEYYLSIKPYLVYLGEHIEIAFQNMGKGFTDINTITTEIAESAKK